MARGKVVLPGVECRYDPSRECWEYYDTGRWGWGKGEPFLVLEEELVARASQVALAMAVEDAARGRTDAVARFKRFHYALAFGDSPAEVEQDPELKAYLDRVAPLE